MPSPGARPAGFDEGEGLPSRSHFESGRSEALKTLAAEILPIFETRGLTTEAVIAYTLLRLQRAVEGRTFTVQLAAELARRVRAEGRGR